MAKDIDISYMVKFPIGRLLYKSGHTIDSLKHEFNISGLKVRALLEEPQKAPLAWLKTIADLSGNSLQTIVNISSGLTPEDKHYLDEEIEDIIDEDKRRREEWGNSYEQRLKELREEKRNKLIPKWITDGKDGVRKSEYYKKQPKLDYKEVLLAYEKGIVRNSEINDPVVKKEVEDRRKFAKENPTDRACIKFNYFCARCKSPEYFTLERCFSCRWFENDKSLADLRKIKPPLTKNFFLRDEERITKNK